MADYLYTDNVFCLRIVTQGDLKCTFILANNSPLDHAIRFYPHKIGRFDSYTESLQLALASKRGIHPDQANDVNFIAISAAQLNAAFCPEAIMEAWCRHGVGINPIAYCDFHEFHRLAAELVDSHSSDLELGNDYLFTFELAERIAPKLHLI